MPEFTRYKKRISRCLYHCLSHGEKNPVTLLDAGSLTAVLFRRPDALRRLTGLRSAPVVAKPTSPGRRATSGLRHPRCTSPTSTFFPLFTFFLFYFISPFSIPFLFFLFFVYLYLYIFLFFFFLCVSLCIHIASLPERNSINCCRLYFRAYACLYILFFLLLRCICLAAAYFFLFLDTLACTFFFLYAYPCVYF